MSTASVIADTILAARSGSSSRVAPAPVFVTFLTGQPKLRSTRSAPAASTMRAASAIVLGIRAEQLDRERVLVGGDAEVAERPFVAVLDPGAADHLGAHEAGAEAPALAAEGLHADARHRREDEPRRYLDRPDRPALAEVDHRLGNGRSPPPPLPPAPGGCQEWASSLGCASAWRGSRRVLRSGDHTRRSLSEGRDPHPERATTPSSRNWTPCAPSGGARSPSGSGPRASSATSPRTPSTTTRRTSRRCSSTRSRSWKSGSRTPA